MPKPPKHRMKPIKRMRLTLVRKQLFIDMLEKTGRFALAAREASPAHYKSPERTFRDELSRDPIFAENVQAAIDHYRDVVGGEVRKRAIEGWDEPVFWQGEVVGRVKKYDNRLLLAEARRVDPSYRESQQHAHLHAHQHTEQKPRFDTSQLTDDEKRQMLALIKKVTPGQQQLPAPAPPGLSRGDVLPNSQHPPIEREVRE